MLTRDDQQNTANRMISIAIMCLVLSAADAAKSPPHILFILVDDVGWADTSLLGSHQIPTPNMDALAANGALLSQYYTQPTCTPSRASLLTGAYPIRLGLQHDVLLPAESGGIDLSVPTIAEQLQKLGYRTHAVGKWHLGYSNASYTPTGRGFDTFFGSYNTCKYYFGHTFNFLNICGTDFWENETMTRENEDAYNTELLTDHAINVIARHDASKPLFMYLSTLAAHGQTAELVTTAPERNLAKFPHIGDRNRTLFAGTMDALDESVGRVVEALHEHDMLSNSVVVLASDNGGIPWGVFSNTGSNWPLRGVKGTLWEGGIRVPALVWSPHVERTVVSNLVHVVDWLPTLYSAAGGLVSDLGVIDGFNLWPELSGTKDASLESSWPRHEFLVNADPESGLSAYRDGDYKLVSVTMPAEGSILDPFREPGLQRHVPTPGGKLHPDGKEDAAKYLDSLMTSSLAWKILEKFYGRENAVPLGWRRQANAVRCSPNNSSWSVPGIEDLREGNYLFDVARDPCELNNLASEEPLVVARLSEKLKAYEAAAMPPKKHEVDPNGMPHVNDCVWARWEERAQMPKSACSC